MNRDFGIPEIFGTFLGSLVLTAIAIFFFGGEPSVWIFFIFFGALWLTYNPQVRAAMMGSGTWIKNTFRVTKAMIFGVLAAVLLLYISAVWLDKPIGNALQDRLAMAYYAGLIGIFIAWQAGWTKGDWGRKAVVFMFTALFFYGLSTHFVPAVPAALKTLLAMVNEPLSRLGGVNNEVKEKLPPRAQSIIDDFKIGRKATAPVPSTVPPGYAVPKESDFVVASRDVRRIHVPLKNPLTLVFPESAAELRRGKACFRDENTGRERCEDAEQTIRKTGGRVPCFPGPLRLTILPTPVEPNVITLQAADAKTCNP